MERLKPMLLLKPLNGLDHRLHRLVGEKHTSGL
jgi:hypothetical protein